MKKITALILILVLSLSLMGCSEENNMPAKVAGDITCTSYGNTISMNSVKVKIYNNENSYNVEASFAGDEQTKATFETKIDEKGTYNVKLTIKPAYSTTSYDFNYENVYVIEDGSYTSKSFEAQLNI